jgi:uroporphyrinogen decarboxylase
MKPRERILAAVNRRIPDRVPLDFGGTMGTTITATAYERLRAYLGMPPDPSPAVCSRRGSTVFPDNEILKRFRVDARPLLPGMPEGQPFIDLPATAFLDEWGVTWSRDSGECYMPGHGPLECLDDPSLRDIEGIRWPDPGDPGRYRGLRERAATLHGETDFAVVLDFWVGPVHLAQFIRGFTQWLEDLLIRPAFAAALMDRILEVWLGVAERCLREAGDSVDVVVFYDDIGTQKGPLISPELYRRLVKPRHRRMAETIKRHGKPLLYHSCGSVYAFIPDLIDVGIDALNPIQVSARGMDTRKLKQEFGRDIAFWGGIDSQVVLSRGTPGQVREEVKHRIDDLGGNGGYVLCAVHNIQPEVPPENIVAMYEAALEYGS